MRPQDTDLRKTKTFLDELWDPRTARILSTIIITLIAFEFLRHSVETLTLFLFAVLFAYFLEPLVARLQGPLRGRKKAITAVYILLFGALTIIGFIVGPAIGTEARQLTVSLPSLLGQLGSGQLVVEFGHKHNLKPALINQIKSLFMSHRQDILNIGKAIGSQLAAPARHIWWLILIPILSVFFLVQGERMAEGVARLGRSALERRMIIGLLEDVNTMLGGYIRAVIILAALTATAYTTVLALMQVPYAFILGPAAGFLEFIPVVGPAVGAVGITVISFLAGYNHVLWVILFLGIWRLVQDYFSAPRIMGNSVEINPLLQIFAVLVGGEIAGVTGALISVPVVATLKILSRRFETEPDETALVLPT